MAERSRTTRGTSLVEVLVVIVVFLIGILAIAQIFPGGFKLLVAARERTLAQQLCVSELQLLEAKPSELPEDILPVDYVPNGGSLDVVEQPNKHPNELSPPGDALNSIGMIFQGATAKGYWAYLSGPNIMRRVVGEGHRVPSPRSVGGFYGSLLTLNYGPVLTSSDNLTTIVYNPLFEIYGQDLVMEQGVPGAGVSPTYEFYIDQANTGLATLYLPRTQAAAGVDDRIYRVSMTIWVADSLGKLTRRETTGMISVPSDPAGGFQNVTVSSYLAGPPALIGGTDTLSSVAPESIRIARKFKDMTGTGFTTDSTTNRPNNPYEYEFGPGMKALGQVLFSPAGYNYYEARPEGRVPLTARVSYDVFDWRILHEDFRIPDAGQPQQFKLMVSSLRVKGHALPDGTTYNGMNVQLLNFTGTAITENRDFGLIDLESGGVYLPNSYNVDMSSGVVTFVDQDSGTPGTQMRILYPGASTPAMVNVAGRSVRALYMANGDWSLQPLKAASQYVQTYGRPGAGQYYVGGSAGFGGSATRIYFPWCDLNQKIKVGEVLYVRAGDTTPRSLKDQDFIVQFGTPADPLNLPYIDVKDVDGAALAVDTDATNGTNAYGYAVKDMRGTSVAARAIWNSSSFSLTADSTANLGALNTYQSNYKRNELETVVQRSDKP